LARALQNGGIQALVAIINANPLKSAHPHAICVGQMAAAVALQHILMRLPHASEAIVQARNLLRSGHQGIHACCMCCAMCRHLGSPLPGGDDVIVMVTNFWEAIQVATRWKRGLTLAPTCRAEC
jgi:hypothetical protein